MLRLSERARLILQRREQPAGYLTDDSSSSTKTQRSLWRDRPAAIPSARAASVAASARPAPRYRLPVAVLGLCLFLLGAPPAQSFTLQWQDNATDATGYAIERGPTTTGPFATLVTGLAANATTYVDDTATPGTRYCYRVYGYNSAGASGYSNIACGTAQVQTYTITVVYAGTGTGTVAGGGTYPAGTAVQVTAVPATGSTFGGWSGGGCSGMLTTCTLNLTSNVIVTASFTLASTSTSTVAVQTAGTGTGTVSGGGTYTAGATVTLTATPASGSTFAGWSGSAPCPTATNTPVTFTMPTANVNCTATFNLAGSTPTSVTFNPPPPGPEGTWVGVFDGINWGRTWAWWRPEAGIPVNHVDFGAAGVTSRTFTFSPGPKTLRSISFSEVTTRSTGGSITISDNNGQWKIVSIRPGQALTIQINWPKASKWVKVYSALGWDMAVTSLTYK